MNFLPAGATPADAIIHDSSAGDVALIAQEVERGERQARRARTRDRLCYWIFSSP